MMGPDRTYDTSRPAALELDGVSVGHGRHALVRHISFALAPGEVMALIGPNGSGKTTILKTIAGQLAPLAGTIALGGSDLRTLPAATRARRLAALFTARPRTELLSCKDVVDAGRYPYTGRLGILSEADEACVRAAMEATGTWEIRNRDFAHMSDGQRQRALIARSLSQDPDVLILDEPTSYLDIQAQLDMLRLLRERARARGMAVLCSLHEIDLASKAADRVICVHDGTASAAAAPDEAFTAARIEALYGLREAAYLPAFGSFEMDRREGAPRVFVIAGGTAGVDTFRALQRADIPFATGVLSPDDADGMLARSLAARAIFSEPFEPVGREQVERAREVLGRCEALICCVERFGTMNAANEGLLEFAKAHGILCYRSAAHYLAHR